MDLQKKNGVPGLNAMHIKHVQQECSQSCGIACVAMVTGKPFTDIRKQVESVPISNYTLHTLLNSNGIVAEHAPFLQLFPDEVYIMAAPSLNRGGSMHYIVVDTRETPFKVYDPNVGIDDKQVYSHKTIRSWGVLTKVTLADDFIAVGPQPASDNVSNEIQKEIAKRSGKCYKCKWHPEVCPYCVRYYGR